MRAFWRSTAILSLLWLHVCSFTHAAELTAISDTTNYEKQALSEKQIRRLERQYARMQRRMHKNNLTLLAKVLKMETALRTGKDSMRMADRNAYQSLQTLVADTSTHSFQLHSLNAYMPRLDSIQSGIAFLKQQGVLSLPSLDKLGDRVNTMGKEWQNSLAIQQFIGERRELLKGVLGRSGSLHKLLPFQKEVYYYQQQVQQFKDFFKDPDVLAAKLIGMARQNPGFTAFIGNHSWLTQLFGMPGNNTGNAVTAGLQTRALTQLQIAQRLQGVSDPAQFISGQLQAANQELNQLKDRVNRLGGGGTEMDMPNFKPNQQKTKTFWKRIEWGINLQSQRPNSWFPVTTDLALMAGYKINDRSVVGIGLSYKLGWGKSIREISMSNQGLGIRTYTDIKLKGSIWLSGGYELNYQQEFSRLDILKQMDAWQRSGLIGLTKKFKAGKKTGNLQLFWDFLSYSQQPRTTALKFRIGYMF